MPPMMATPAAKGALGRGAPFGRLRDMVGSRVARDLDAIAEKYARLLGGVGKDCTRTLAKTSSRCVLAKSIPALIL
jgi:hypothetical protein